MSQQATSITDLSASALSTAIHQREVSCVQVMQAYWDRIAQLNPIYNAIVSLRSHDELITQAKQYDALLAQGQSMGWLHGIPQAIKDISPVAGLPSTMGSPLLKNFIPKEDGLLAQRTKAAGAIVIGKTNTPEFGLGSHTFNEVFGSTKNAYDISKTAGGSSGGAAVALAQRLLPVADGSDFMGSLRNPAGWNNVLGFRPSQGRVPMWPTSDVWIAQLGTEGPMARNVQDLARLLRTQSGFDARQPLSLESTEDFSKDLDQLNPKQVRVGWLGDLQGYLAMEPGVLSCCETALKQWQSAGVTVEPIKANFSPEQTWTQWLAWRRWLVGARLAPFLVNANNRNHIKPEGLWEYDQSRGMTAVDASVATQQRTEFYQQIIAHFEHYDVLALPSAQCWPFDVAQRWPSAIAGRAMDTYHRWMEVVIYATYAGLPCASVPIGFSDGGNAGLPIGLQLIGKPRGDKALLQVLRQIEIIAPWDHVRPSN
jgi:amidase